MLAVILLVVGSYKLVRRSAGIQRAVNGPGYLEHLLWRTGRGANCPVEHFGCPDGPRRTVGLWIHSAVSAFDADDRLPREKAIVDRVVCGWDAVRVLAFEIVHSHAAADTEPRRPVHAGNQSF
jgi:hypothetical protein